MMASLATSSSSAWSITGYMPSWCRRRRRCKTRTRLRRVTGAQLIQTPGGDEIIERQQRTQNYREEKNETRSAQSTVRRARHLPRRSLPHQFNLEHARGIFLLGRFMLAAIGIHRKES